LKPIYALRAHYSRSQRHGEEHAIQESFLLAKRLKELWK
jgi:hypothetical protein